MTAADLNGNIAQASTTNSTPQCVQGDSVNLTQMQTTVDPYPSQVPSLATSLEGELQRLRFVLKTALGFTQWYSYTDPMILGPQVLSGTNAAGSNTTLQGGPGTGTGAGGSILFRVAYPGSSGSTANAETTVGTVTAANNASSGTYALWSLAGTVAQSATAGYTLLQANATETSIGTGTNLLLDLQVGGVSKFRVDRTGTILSGTSSNTAGRLTFGSATQVKFCPYNGASFSIPTPKAYTIPSACVQGANTSVFLNGASGSNLAASTTYFVYLFDNGGTLTLDFCTTGHATDATTGIEVASGPCGAFAANTHALVGMVRTNAASQFEADNALQGVLSWYNRRGIALVNNFTAGRTTASTTYTEVNSEIRANFLTWADEAVQAQINGQISGNVSSTIATSVGFDTTTVPEPQVSLGNSTTGMGIGLSLTRSGLTEGFHFATLLGLNATGNTTSWQGGATGGGQAVATTLAVGIRG